MSECMQDTLEQNLTFCRTFCRTLCPDSISQGFGNMHRLPWRMNPLLYQSNCGQYKNSGLKIQTISADFNTAVCTRFLFKNFGLFEFSGKNKKKKLVEDIASTSDDSKISTDAMERILDNLKCLQHRTSTTKNYQIVW